MELTIERLTTGGAGIGFHDGKAIFVPYAAPGDRVEVAIKRDKKRHATATLLKVLEKGPARDEPICPVYGQCGGCQIQHLTTEGRAGYKSMVVKETLERIGHFTDPPMQPLIAAKKETDYRSRCGLKIRWVDGEALVGFFQTASKKVVNIPGCPVLHPKLEALIEPLRAMVGELNKPERLPQVDLRMGDEGLGMIFHMLSIPSQRDKNLLKKFAFRHNVTQVWVQQGDKQGRSPLVTKSPLRYRPDDHHSLTFMPGDFTQAHLGQNRLLVKQAIKLMGQGTKALDLFSGIGNFTFSLREQFTDVLGIEGDEQAVKRGMKNAEGREGVRFETQNLFDEQVCAELPLEGVEAILVDPPREGAVELAKRLKETSHNLVWVSCDPATFARDANILCSGRYQLASVQPVDMFPMTSHVELVAHFTAK
uniref:Putative 23S rRNA (Uracil-5-)-methyltransferase rumA. (RumA) n=1 Tax=Magnetococcus massalia (strain MO-1) TaxID=451514 RepID=A0A1S7LMU4_MAGMO|nr:putative 23S rRNA (uracil-5-)-methyltransferase rumA. (rumA) [Candidatus Magnetococcus massalia]